MVKNQPPSAGDIRYVGSIPEMGRSTEEKMANPLQYSCLEDPMDRGAWWATVHGVTKSHGKWVGGAAEAGDPRARAEASSEAGARGPAGSGVRGDVVREVRKAVTFVEYAQGTRAT